MPPSETATQGILASPEVLPVLRKLRVDGRALEILLMPGFVLAAIPFAGEITSGRLVTSGLLLSAASILLVAGVYATNSYFGFPTDRFNARLQIRRWDNPSRYPPMAVVALLASLVIFGRIGSTLPWLAILSFLLWVIYSVPQGAKSRPIWGTAVHFLSQVVQFHLGFLAFSSASPRSVLISFFFAALFSGGHLIHEVKDYASDRVAGIRTNVVVYGPAKVVAFYRASLVLLPFYWGMLFLLKLLTPGQFVPFFLATILHVALSRFRDIGPLGRSMTFQRSYRAIYLAAGLVTFAASRL
jgi:4-hydroxybenzoate polyprenyltransferase